MRTAIRNLGWLFLFLGGLKSLMGLMGFYGKKTTSLPPKLPPTNKRRTAITGSPSSIVI